MQFNLSTPKTVKQSFSNFLNGFSNYSQCPNFQDFYDVSHLNRSILYSRRLSISMLIRIITDNNCHYDRHKDKAILLCKLNAGIFYSRYICN